MNDQHPIQSEVEEYGDIEAYGDKGITSANAPVPTFLKWTYILLPIWGIIWFYLYWNGMYGWLDRGYWQQLERAANTTFPVINHNNPKND